MKKCGQKCEIWNRVCGYYRPVAIWNKGKKQEFIDRKTYDDLSGKPHDYKPENKKIKG